MTSFWDPENLLRVTDDLRSQAGEIKCLGKMRYNARCRLNIPEANLSEVRPLLGAMSQVKPESITNETLQRLARLCLCIEYHSNQAEQVVSHWTRVLETATQHHQRLLDMENSSSDEIQILKRDIALKNDECKDLRRKLDREIASNAQQNDEWEDKSDEMTTKITHLEQQLSRSENRLTVTEAAISDQEQAKQTLLEQNKEESAARIETEEENVILQSRLKTSEDKLEASEDKLKANEDKLKRAHEENENLTKYLATVRESNEVGFQACQDEISQLKATVQNLTKERDDKDAKLKTSEDKLKIVREEKKNLIKELATVGESNEVGFQACQDEISQLKTTVQGLTRERDDKDTKLQEYHAQLGKQLAQNTLLDDRIASLEQTQAQLEASIVSCWMHSFWAWTTRFKGRRSKPQLVEGNMELKTYA
ncbi:hypothetical protein CEP54_007161 [Fusarium duplospermum]|uniref:Uncharacterized protein n=1 Tax=Fusarium duplospermum TaxID=1325734 RepID=A0A428Q375_9HYPO|nr:hypothetical protein CEP54_007161 [Fusarium duplospermum]